jgi:hypothetical protein
MLRLTGIVVTIAVSLAATGCTWQQTAYFVGQQWQRNACNRLPDQFERERCFSNANMSYDEYRRRVEGTKKE